MIVDLSLVRERIEAARSELRPDPGTDVANALREIIDAVEALADKVAEVAS